MTRLACILLIALAASAAAAQPRPSTLDKPCAANRALVDSRGAIVLGTGGHTYDRFVRDRGFCQFDEFARPAFVPSRDSQACFIGYRCDTNSPWE